MANTHTFDDDDDDDDDDVEDDAFDRFVEHDVDVVDDEHDVDDDVDVDGGGSLLPSMVCGQTLTMGGYSRTTGTGPYICFFSTLYFL